MPPAGFEPAIPASERPQTLALARSATHICLIYRNVEYFERGFYGELFRSLFFRCYQFTAASRGGWPVGIAPKQVACVWENLVQNVMFVNVLIGPDGGCSDKCVTLYPHYLKASAETMHTC